MRSVIIRIRLLVSLGMMPRRLQTGSRVRRENNSDCPPRPSGSMPAGQGAALDSVLGTVTANLATMPGVPGIQTAKPTRWVKRSPMYAGFTICMGMSGSSVGTGMTRAIISKVPAIPPPKAPLWARTVCTAVGRGNGYPGYLRSADRDWGTPGNRRSGLGFRLVCSQVSR